MKISITLLSIITFGLLAIPAQANNNSPDYNRYDRIEQRLENQFYRIRDGINNGKLTRKEARNLRKQQRFLMRMKHKFMHDRYLDRYEFRELRDALDRAGKRIYRLKHNAHNRYGRHNRHYYY